MEANNLPPNPLHNHFTFLFYNFLNKTRKRYLLRKSVRNFFETCLKKRRKKMKKIITILTIATLALQAGSFTITEQARVIKSKPIYKTITKRVPYQECWEESVPVQRYNSRYERRDEDPLGLLIGSVAGGIIGNQVGKGRGKTVATVGGALIGGMVGHNLSRKNHHRRDDSYTSYENRQRCVTRYNEHEEEKFVGYKNIANYKGKRIVKISNRKLRYIPITLSYSY
jgi:uncharacterized protein YcfJ